MGWGQATRGACVRPSTRGAEERAVWLMCPIKLLQTLPRQLLPAGPWVQIGSVSLPRGGVSGARKRWPAQLALGRPSPALPNLGPPCSLRHPLGSSGPLGPETGAPCTSPCHPDPHPQQPGGPSEPSLSFSRKIGVPGFIGGPAQGHCSWVTQPTLFPPLIITTGP